MTDWPNFALENRTKYIVTDCHMVAGELCNGATLTAEQRRRLERAAVYLDTILAGNLRGLQDVCADVEEKVNANT